MKDFYPFFFLFIFKAIMKHHQSCSISIEFCFKRIYFCNSFAFCHYLVVVIKILK